MIGKTILHYNIEEKLGEGGMGVVYKAKDTKLKRDVAIKFLPHFISTNEEEKERFEIEAQAAAALNHPNISTIHAIEEYQENIFIVMEYIDGPELKDKINKGSLELNEMLDIMEQSANGLKAAHKGGIIHRDIKSSNIMLTKSGTIKIMDFGLAKVKGTGQLTKIGTTIGTPCYMSPEQAQGERSDNRSDIWSLGVIFYEMLTGKLPYDGEFEQAIIYSILNVEPESIPSINETIPSKIEQIVKRMLTKDKNLRYQDLGEFLNDLKDFRNNTKSTKTEEKSIAVLPFENISPDKDTDYFGDGLTEELIINLSRIKDVSVLARTTSMQFKNSKKDVKTIGKELGVLYLIEGSVRKFKDDLRI